MTYAFLPFFLLWLFVHVGWSFARMGLFFLGSIKTFLISLAFALVAFFFFYQSLFSPLTQAQSHYLQDNTFETYKELLVVFARQHYAAAQSIVNEQGVFFAPEGKRELFKAIKQNEKIKQETQYWEKNLALQPTARDVLINLSRLYRWQGDETRSTKYFEEAQKIDPNHN